MTVVDSYKLDIIPSLSQSFRHHRLFFKYTQIQVSTLTLTFRLMCNQCVYYANINKEMKDKLIISKFTDII